MAFWNNEHTQGLAIALAAATVASFLRPTAFAAVPQILGLVATAEPTPLNCADGLCGAEFSSFCLQQEKPAPAMGTEYRAANGSDFTLVYTDADGATAEIDAAPYVVIDSQRRYAAVRISLPEDLAHMLGARDLALRIGAHASAVPATIADDPSPLTMAEIGKVTGSLRRLAERLFDPGSDTAVAAATAIKLVNAARDAEPPTPIDVAALWRKALGETADGDEQPGVGTVAQDLQRCPTTHSGLFTACLQRIHEDSITQANLRVWAGLAEAGS
jgi:hypothetical protein